MVSSAFGAAFLIDARTDARVRRASTSIVARYSSILAGALSRAPAGRPLGVPAAIRGAGRAAAPARGRRLPGIPSKHEAEAEAHQARIGGAGDLPERRAAERRGRGVRGQRGGDGER